MGYVDHLAASRLEQLIKDQKWYQKNANTFTTIIGFITTVMTWAASQPFGADPRVENAILILGFILTVFGVRQTKNGWSQSQVDKLRDLVDEEVEARSVP